MSCVPSPDGRKNRKGQDPQRPQEDEACPPAPPRITRHAADAANVRGFPLTSGRGLSDAPGAPPERESPHRGLTPQTRNSHFQIRNPLRSMPSTLIWWVTYARCQPTVARHVARGSCPCSFLSQAHAREAVRALATLCQHMSVNVSAEGSEDGHRIVQAGVGVCCAATDSRRNADVRSSRWYCHLAYRTPRPTGLGVPALACGGRRFAAHPAESSRVEGARWYYQIAPR